MAERLTAEEGRRSMLEHAAGKGEELRAKYGPRIGWRELQAVLRDPALVRYPTELRFDASALEPGEVAYPAPRGERPEDGFVLHVHPYFLTRLEEVPLLALYQLVAINYGPFAGAEEAEAFAAAALGLNTEEYYERLCTAADEIAGEVPRVEELAKEG